MDFFGFLSFLLYVIPIAAAVFFIVSISLFISDRAKNRKNAGSISEERLHKNKVMLIVSSIILGVVVLLYGAVIIIFMRAVAYM